MKDNYWDKRYRSRNGDTITTGSGLGSSGDAITKRIKQIEKHVDGVDSILDVGCGDMNVGLAIIDLFPNAKYLGLDSSKYLIDKLKEQLSDIEFEYIKTSKFKHTSELVLCFDVLYHIVDDDEYELMLESLKNSWSKYLIIITDNKDGTDADENSDYMKKRVFDPTFFSKDYIVETDIENELELGSSIAMYIFKK